MNIYFRRHRTAHTATRAALLPADDTDALHLRDLYLVATFPDLDTPADLDTAFQRTQHVDTPWTTTARQYAGATVIDTSARSSAVGDVFAISSGCYLVLALGFARLTPQPGEPAHGHRVASDH